MARPKKQAPMEAFSSSIADAEVLLSYADAFGNKRARRMRRELRLRVGAALRFPRRDQDNLDCIESDDLFVIFRPGSSLSRSDFEDRRPLLRQAIVAGSAAFETYVADKAIEQIGNRLRAQDPPDRMKAIQLSVGHWLEIEERYERRAWGIRAIVEEHLREISSPAPNRVGEVLSTIGASKWAAQVDQHRKVTKGTTVSELQEIADRRNQIAHSADRVGQGRARLESAEVHQYLEVLCEVAVAIEDIVNRL